MPLSTVALEPDEATAASHGTGVAVASRSPTARGRAVAPAGDPAAAAVI
ncbi:hypothetical protein [Micromonospora rosaria]